MNLLGGTHFSLDGVKLYSNASKEWSGTFKELRKKRDKLKKKLAEVISAKTARYESVRQERKRYVSLSMICIGQRRLIARPAL